MFSNWRDFDARMIAQSREIIRDSRALLASSALAMRKARPKPVDRPHAGEGAPPGEHAHRPEASGVGD